MIFNRWNEEYFKNIKAILKKTKDILRKIVLVIILVGAVLDVGGGLLYEKYCQDKIIAREQYLLDVSRTLIPPPDAIKIKESMFRKLIYRSYTMYYQYEKSTDEVFRYYANELTERGYEVERIRTNKLRGQKGDIIIEIACDPSKDKFSVDIIFDDIYEKMRFYKG